MAGTLGNDVNKFDYKAVVAEMERRWEISSNDDLQLEMMKDTLVKS